MKSKLAGLLFLALLAGGGAFTYWHFYMPREISDGRIRVSGNIETTEAQVAFKIPGRVIERKVDEGDDVHRGETVALLDKGDLECTVAMRKADLGVAEAALAALLAGSRPQEIASAKAAWEKAEHTLADLEAGSRPQEIVAAEAAAAGAAAEESRLLTEYRRKTPLFQRGTITSEEYDAARAAYQVALERHRQAVAQLKLAQEGYRKQRIEEARAAAAQAKAQYDLVKAGPRQEDIDQGKARAKQAKAALALAETQLSYATVVSPLTGVVLSKNIEPGEYVAPGTAVVTVGDLVNVWLRAYIEEGDLGRVKLHQRAWVTNDSFPGKKYEGVVSFIAADAEFTPKNVQTQKERVKLVYRIKIDIKNPDKELKPGMPADAVIETTP
ncbi:MAG: efflux RND transporter periplasmic adaptor subunit [Thermoguttaceae bacterium]|jgi:HlyD family secretion protein